MKLTTILVLKMILEILYFSIFHMNEMKHQQNHIWFKGENLKKSTLMPLSICLSNHINRIIDTYLLFIT